MHPWDKSHLIMVYDPFKVFFYLFANILLSIFVFKFFKDIGL